MRRSNVMARFNYKAKTTSQGIVEGILEAETSSSAVQKLGAMGYFPIQIEKEEPAGGVPRLLGAPKKIPIAHMSTCLRQLSDLLEAGLPLSSVVTMAAEQTSHERL